MSDQNVSLLVGQFVGVIPLLLVYALAVVLALVFWSRARTPAILTILWALVSCGVLLIAPLVRTSVLSMHRAGRIDADSVSSSLATLGIASAFLQAFGLVLLVVAVFVGRPRTALQPA